MSSESIRKLVVEIEARKIGFEAFENIVTEAERAQAAIKNLNTDTSALTAPTVGTFIDTSKAQEALTTLRQEIETTPPANMKLVVSSNIIELRNSLLDLDAQLGSKTLMLDKTQAAASIDQVESAINALPKDIQLKLDTAQTMASLGALKTELGTVAVPTVGLTERFTAMTGTLTSLGSQAHNFMNMLDRIEISELNVENAMGATVNSQLRYNQAVANSGASSRQAFIAHNELERSTNRLSMAQKRASMSTMLIGVALLGTIGPMATWAMATVKSLKTVELATFLTTARIKAMVPELLILSVIAGGAYYLLASQAAKAQEATDSMTAAMNLEFDDVQKKLDGVIEKIKEIKGEMEDFAGQAEKKKIELDETINVINQDAALSAEEKLTKSAEARLKYNRAINDENKAAAEKAMDISAEHITALEDEIAKTEALKDASGKKAVLTGDQTKELADQKTQLAQWTANKLNALAEYRTAANKDAKLTAEDAKKTESGYKGIGSFSGISRNKNKIETSVEETVVLKSDSLAESLRLMQSEAKTYDVNVTGWQAGVLETKTAIGAGTATGEPTTLDKFNALTPEQQAVYKEKNPEQAIAIGRENFLANYNPLKWIDDFITEQRKNYQAYQARVDAERTKFAGANTSAEFFNIANKPAGNGAISGIPGQGTPLNLNNPIPGVFQTGMPYVSPPMVVHLHPNAADNESWLGGKMISYFTKGVSR